jgi:hypothetical protein
LKLKQKTLEGGVRSAKSRFIAPARRDAEEYLASLGMTEFSIRVAWRVRLGPASERISNDDLSG